MEYDYSENYILKLLKLLLNRSKYNLAWNIRPQFYTKIHIDRLIVPHCGGRSQKFDLISNFSLGQYQDFQIPYQYDWSMHNLAWNIQSLFHTEIDTDQLPLWVNKDVICKLFLWIIWLGRILHQRMNLGVLNFTWSCALYWLQRQGTQNWP